MNAPKLYHVRLTVKGAFPRLRCLHSLVEEYCDYFSSFEKAIEFAQQLMKPFEAKAKILGNVESVDPVYVCEVDTNPLWNEESYYAYGQ
jgi:hypothetical protein